MKVAIKTLNQEIIEIDIAEDKSVLDLKAEIFNLLGGDYVVERQLLICGSKIMDDEKPIAMYNTGACKFIMVLLCEGEKGSDSQYSTITAANSKVAASATQIVAESESLFLTGQDYEQATSKVAPSATQIVTETESHFLTGQDYEQAVDIMVEIGFDRASVERAMAASFNNTERAFELLTNELIEHHSETQTTAASSAANTQINAETVKQILELLRQNPHLLTATLQQMGVTNTELLEQIRNNTDAFFNLIRQNEQTGVLNNAQYIITPSALDEFRRSKSAAAAVDNKAEPAAQPATTAAMASFTPADRAAIERLKAMGFQEAMVVPAYIAFDKDEALAANFLASNVDDEN